MLFFELTGIDQNRDDLADGADGLSMRVSWSKLPETLPDWDGPLMLRLMAGFRAPDGVWDTVHIERYDRRNDQLIDIVVPAPWDMRARHAVCDAQVWLFNAAPIEPYCMHTAGWEDSSEMDAPEEMEAYPDWEQVAIDWHRSQVFALRDAGFEGLISLNVAPPGGKPWVPRIIEWAATQPNVVVQSNALGAQHKNESVPFLNQIIRYPGNSAWQMLCPWTNQDRFNRLDRPNFGLTEFVRVAKLARPLFMECYVPAKKRDSLLAIREAWNE